MRITGAPNPALTRTPDAGSPLSRPAAVRSTDTAGRIDRVDTVNRAERALNARSARLLAAVVPGSIDFAGADPTPARAPTPFYRRPADAHAAATGVALGSRLDVTG